MEVAPKNLKKNGGKKNGGKKNDDKKNNKSSENSYNEHHEEDVHEEHQYNKPNILNETNNIYIVNNENLVEMEDNHEYDCQNEDHSENDEKSSENSESSYFTIKENYLNMMNEVYKISIELAKFNPKKFDFDKDDIKLLDSEYKKYCANNNKINQKMLLINRDKKAIKKDKFDENGNKIVKDTSDHPINKKRVTFKEVLDFLELPENTMISRSDVHRGITNFIKIEKEKPNTDIFFDETKKSVKIIGKLRVLFEFIRNEKIRRGVMTENEVLPQSITNTDIMKYISYCFPVEPKPPKEPKVAKTTKGTKAK